MTPEDLYKIILEIDENWSVTSIEVDETKEEVSVTISYINSKAADPVTGEICSLYDHREERIWRHLDTMQYKTYIKSTIPRVKNSLGKVNTIAMPWADKLDRFTYLLEKKVIDLLQATKNQTKTAALMRMGFIQINRILYNAVERGLSRRTTISEIRNISIDEKSFKRGHDYVTVLSSPDTGAVIDVSSGRKKESVKKVLNDTFTKEQKSQIETVTTDMWEAYITTAKEDLPTAKLCHDKFHLVKYLNEAVDIVRRKETKIQEELRHTRYIWLKDQMNLTEKQRLKFEAINNTNYETARAWRIKENFRDITFNQPREEAFILFMRWCNDALKSQINAIIKVAEMFQRHMTGIVNAINLGKSNAMAERLNGKIQEIKLSAKGYRTFENFRAAILLARGKYLLYKKPDKWNEYQKKEAKCFLKIFLK